MDKISIIVPIYNSEKYLDECIQSILEQTYNNFELILVNDGSDDKSLSICNNYINDDKRIKLLNLKHKGVQIARNTGIENAKGQWICFIDSDDIVDRDFLQTLIRLVKKYNTDIAEVDFLYKGEKVRKNKEQVELYNSDEMANRLYSKYGIKTAIITNKIYNKQLFSDIKFDPDKPNEDEFIVHKLIYATKKKIVVSNQKLYIYRIREDSSQRTFSSQKLEVLQVFDERKEYFKNDEKLLEKNQIAKIDMILYLYYICSINKQQELKEILKNKFKEEYSNLNISLNMKRKIKYYLFERYPDFVSDIIKFRQRRNYG